MGRGFSGRRGENLCRKYKGGKPRTALGFAGAAGKRAAEQGCTGYCNKRRTVLCFAGTAGGRYPDKTSSKKGSEARTACYFPVAAGKNTNGTKPSCPLPRPSAGRPRQLATGSPAPVPSPAPAIGSVAANTGSRPAAHDRSRPRATLLPAVAGGCPQADWAGGHHPLSPFLCDPPLRRVFFVVFPHLPPPARHPFCKKGTGGEKPIPPFCYRNAADGAQPR